MSVDVGKRVPTYCWCNRSAPPGSVGIPPAKILAKMAALPGKGRGAERLHCWLPSIALDSGNPDRNDGIFGTAGLVYNDERRPWER